MDIGWFEIDFGWFVVDSGWFDARFGWFDGRRGVAPRVSLTAGGPDNVKTRRTRALIA